MQEDIADRLLPMLAGAMAELRIGDPALLATDVGPVIDDEARQALQRHADADGARGPADLSAARCRPAPSTAASSRRGPIEIDGAFRLEREVFGPILHVVRWPADGLDRVLDEIAATGYALTLGVHSRIDDTVDHVLARVGVGNAYVNRNMIGAVVGVQPFGGERLSGTGPKAGGPRYLHRFATERTVSIDTTAAGGNATPAVARRSGQLSRGAAADSRCRGPNLGWHSSGPRDGRRQPAAIGPAGQRRRPLQPPEFPCDLAGVAQMSRRHSGEFAAFRANCCTNVAAGPRFAAGGPIVGLRELKSDCHRKSRW